MRRYRVGLIGYGHWGRNLARVVANHPRTQLAAIVDPDERRIEDIRSAHPHATRFTEADGVLEDEDLDVIAVTSPAGTHFALAMSALERGKHLLVTKPVATGLNQALQLQALAKRKQLVVVVDHTFLYHPCTDRVKRVLDERWLGEPRVFDSTRTGLGIYKDDVNVIADLAVHDLAILEHLFGMPDWASAIAYSSVPGELPDNAVITFCYASGLRAHVRASWLSPLKQRLIVLVGDRQMLVWDDTLEAGRLRAFDTGVDRIDRPDASGRAPLSYRAGIARPLDIDSIEPLRAEVDDLVACIDERRQPVSSLDAAARVVAMVDACDRSSQDGGARVALSRSPGESA